MPVFNLWYHPFEKSYLLRSHYGSAKVYIAIKKYYKVLGHIYNRLDLVFFLVQYCIDIKRQQGRSSVCDLITVTGDSVYILCYSFNVEF